MENKIVTAIFKDSTHTKVSGVWQYDYGQILRIQGLDLPTAVEVDFAVAGASESIARIGTTKDGVTDVVIPDSLIETGKNLVAYIYLRDSASGNTEYQIDMLVTKRAKPEAYDRPEDKELFGQAIEAVNTAADRAEKARQTAQEAAQKAGLDAEQTAQDRVEVAKMVETVTDISEQVKKVEELSNKAQESATQAGTSATAAEKAKAQAETAAGKTAEDRIAVNQAKIDVDEAQKAVRADRAAVEEAKQSVEQLSNAIPESAQVGVQAVNQAKQTAVYEIARTGISHKTAVEGAGTQAVESVDNAKTTATEAVEIAKTEAVQAVQAEGTKQTGNVSAEGAKQIKEVQDKGAEVLQSIPENFATQMETKLNKQQGIENKGKVLVIGEDGNVVPEEVASGGGDGIAIINTMSGESPLVIPDSAERVNKRLELGGKTEQVQTSGKNLLEEKLSAFTITNDIAHIPLPEDHNEKQYTMLIQLKDGKKDTVGFSCGFYDKTDMPLAYKSPCLEGGKIVSSNGIVVSKKGVNHHVCFTPASEDFFDIYHVIYTEGNLTSLPYEPYTGGKPAPSPEYPQEIKSVGKWNEEKQKYEIEVVLSGKNLLDITACEAGKALDSYGNIVNSANGFLTDFIPCFANSPYCRSNKTFTVISFYDRDKNFICCINQYNDEFITPDECRYFRFSINKQGVDYTKAVANVGTALMDYEPYREPKFFILTLNKPLRGIGEMKDELSESGILRRVKSITLNGSEKWYKYENSAFVAMNCYGLKIDDLEVKNYNLTTLCNYLKWAKFPQDIESQAAHGGYIYFTVPKETYPDLESFKEWLAKNTPVLEYRLKEPALEELSEEDKASIRALKTYYPTTVITADGGELDPDIKVTYTADTKNYIDNKVSAKVASIIRQYRLNTANLLSLMPMETQATMIENDTNNILENAEEMKHE